MKDLKIGDRILMIDDDISEEEIYMSVGTVKEVRNIENSCNYACYAIDYEFRVFDGATNVSDLFKRVEFVYKLALVVRENDIYSIQNVAWEDIINKPI